MKVNCVKYLKYVSFILYIVCIDMDKANLFPGLMELSFYGRDRQ